MALIKCPECKKKISESASSCPNCGFELDKKVVKIIKAKEAKDKKSGCTVLIIIIIIVFIINAIDSDSSSDVKRVSVNKAKIVLKYAKTNLNVRSSPDTDSDVLKTLKPNEKIISFDTIVNGFTVILNSDKTIFGWSSNKYLQNVPLSKERMEEVKNKQLEDKEKRKNAWKTKDESIEAWLLAKDYVKRSLKSPASADFPWYDDSFIYKRGTTYTVRSYVDSQNGFGALIRSTFVVELQQISKKNWKLISINIY